MPTSGRSTALTLGPALRVLAFGLGAAAGAYAAHAVSSWVRYGAPRPSSPADADALLDRFMPVYDVVERHMRRIDAPADAVFAAACAQDLYQSPVTRAIFRAREVLLGAASPPARTKTGLLAEVLALGWGVLAETPGREIVVGAVTRPWEPNVVFRTVAPEAFAAFDEPDYVKIAWTLRSDPIDGRDTVFRTETRAVATDASARRRFRLYWAAFSPGISLIRWLSLAPLARDAVRRSEATAGEAP